MVRRGELVWFGGVAFTEGGVHLKIIAGRNGFGFCVGAV